MSILPTIEITNSTIVDLRYGCYIVDASSASVVLTLPIGVNGNNILITRSDKTVNNNTLSIIASGTQGINRQNIAIVQTDKSSLQFVLQNNSWFYGLPSLPRPGATGSAGVSPITAVANIGNSPNANGMSLSDSMLNLQPTDAKNGGVISTQSQQIAGAKRFTDTTANAVTVAGGVGITKRLILGAVGDAGSLTGLKLNNSVSGYLPSLLREYSQVDLAVTALSPFTGSSILYFTRLGKKITMTIGAFSGQSDASTILLFAGIPLPFIPDFPITLPVLVTIGSGTIANAYIDLTINMDGTISLSGARYSKTPIPAGAFTVFQQTITYSQNQANQLVSFGIQRNMPVDISNNGVNIAIGASDDGKGVGAVYIFIRSGVLSNTWTQQSKIIGTAPTQPTGTTIQIIGQGTAVSLSFPGNTLYFTARAIVVDQFNNTTYQYIGWIFSRNISGIWTQSSVSVISSNNVSFGTNQVISVSMDEKTQIYKADVFDGTSIVNSPNTPLTQNFTVNSIFASASVSADGNTLAISDPSNNSVNLYIKVFISGSFRWQAQITVLPSIVSSNVMVGASLALSLTGNVLVIGGPGENLGIGAIWIFTRVNTTTSWSQSIKLAASDSVGTANQGAAVAINNNGTIVVGGPGDNNSLGALWLYTNTGAGYKQLGYKLRGSGYDAVTRQGSSVSIPADGSLVVTGAPQVGITWVFTTSK